MTAGATNTTGLISALHLETPEFKGLRPLMGGLDSVNKNTAQNHPSSGHPQSGGHDQARHQQQAQVISFANLFAGQGTSRYELEPIGGFALRWTLYRV
jgi:hypothetical protein